MQFANDPPKMTKPAFVDQFAGVYEHSAWVAQKAYDDGLPEGVEPMVSTFRAIIEGAGEAPQLTFLPAHPALAGKPAQSGALKPDSTPE